MNDILNQMWQFWKQIKLKYRQRQWNTICNNNCRHNNNKRQKSLKVHLKSMWLSSKLDIENHKCSVTKRIPLRKDLRLLWGKHCKTEDPSCPNLRKNKYTWDMTYWLDLWRLWSWKICKHYKTLMNICKNHCLEIILCLTSNSL